jgi:putative nucleotidyltransferase with HDIG domain
MSNGSETLRDRFRNLLRTNPEEKPAPKAATARPPPPSSPPRPPLTIRAPASVAPAGPARSSTPPADVDFQAFAPKSAAAPEKIDETELVKLGPALLNGVKIVLEDSLPAFPYFANEVLEAAERPEIEMAEMTRLVSRDPLIAAQVLKVANSAMYSRGTPVTDLREAISRLGLREVASIAAIASSQALMNASVKAALAAYPALWRRVWIHSIATSIGTASWLASNMGGAHAPTAFIGGLLHDVGKMVALQGFAHALEYQTVPKLSDRHLALLIERTHIPIGVRVATQSKFPEPVLVVCRDHHRPPAADATGERELNALVVVSVMEEVLAGTPVDDATLSAAVQRAKIMRLDQRLAGTLAASVRVAREKAENILAAA